MLLDSKEVPLNLRDVSTYVYRGCPTYREKVGDVCCVGSRDVGVVRRHVVDRCSATKENRNRETVIGIRQHRRGSQGLCTYRAVNGVRRGGCECRW